MFENLAHRKVCLYRIYSCWNCGRESIKHHSSSHTNVSRFCFFFPYHQDLRRWITPLCFWRKTQESLESRGETGRLFCMIHWLGLLLSPIPGEPGHCLFQPRAAVCSSSGTPASVWIPSQSHPVSAESMWTEEGPSAPCSFYKTSWS